MGLGLERYVYGDDYTAQTEKYLVFAYRDYYPCGGMEDCVLVVSSALNLRYCVNQYIKDNEMDFDNMHYYDCQTGEIYVARFDEDVLPKKRFIKWELRESQ